MNFRTKEAIIKLNTDFYVSNSREFHQNRQGRNWGGVEDCFKYITLQKHAISVLDIACGNARFAGLVSDKFKTSTINYVGVDNNKELIKQSKELVSSLNFEKYRFIEKSVFSKELILPKADLVVALGITHHIPDSKFRKNWLVHLTSFVEKQGYLLLSFWDTDKENTLTELPQLGIYKKDLQEGDMFFSWGKSNVYRYYHKYSEKELSLITNLILDQGFELIKVFSKKEFNKNTNKYYIYKNKLW